MSRALDGLFLAARRGRGFLRRCTGCDRAGRSSARNAAHGGRPSPLGVRRKERRARPRRDRIGRRKAWPDWRGGSRSVTCSTAYSWEPRADGVGRARVWGLGGAWPSVDKRITARGITRSGITGQDPRFFRTLPRGQSHRRARELSRPHRGRGAGWKDLLRTLWGEFDRAGGRACALRGPRSGAGRPQASAPASAAGKGSSGCGSGGATPSSGKRPETARPFSASTDGGDAAIVPDRTCFTSRALCAMAAAHGSSQLGAGQAML